MCEAKPNLPQEILDVLKRHAELPYEYWNPNFLSEINGLLDSYYDLEDPKVDKWIQRMWSKV